jgi:AAA+ ATPase superfamily predicted ATPase
MQLSFKPENIGVLRRFINREDEIERLKNIEGREEPAIIIMYGRRRVGKTELLEQVFRARNILKFEGIEGQDQQYQIQSVLEQIAHYSNSPLVAKLQISKWREVFRLIYSGCEQGTWTIYLEELQWLACYEDELIAELKYAWDNYFRRNPKILVILCGSSPSFMLNHVIRSKALYNRSQHEIALSEFNILNVKKFLRPQRSLREIMDAYLTVGGIPEYLRYVDEESSVLLGLCKNSFTRDSFFLGEYQKVFISSFAKNPHFQEIIELLSKKRFCTRQEIGKHLKINSGGSLSQLLQDLESCGFISKYSPYNVGSNSRIVRYHISDQYLQFYFKFIKPLKEDIKNGDFTQNPLEALPADAYRTWLGFAFERWCRKSQRTIAKILGFERVKYRHGAYFARNTSKKKEPSLRDSQIDLIFERADHVLTICEVKYTLTAVSDQVISEFEDKLQSLSELTKDKFSIERVLISASGAKESVAATGYFSKIITLEDLFKEYLWKNV